jgi:hypothetical protein
MEGAAMRHQREREGWLSTAWFTENFARTGKKFKDLADYLRLLKPKRPQRAEEILEVFREHERRGAKMTIRHIRPGESDG